ncbi:MAG: hypothetical protein J6T72_04085 [Alphaproteobacteria bacterium]|nr:hypothetical protein [Alphaproteobacteria bacterium]
MKKFVIYTILTAFFLCPAFSFAKDGENSLLNSAKKITSPKESPLIPRIDTTAKKEKSKKNNTSKTDFPVYDNEELPKVSSMPNGKSKKSLTDEIIEAGEEEKEEIENEVDTLIKDTWVEKLGDSIAHIGDKINKDGEDDSLETLTLTNDDEKKSNASVFDISGVMLRMTLSQAESALLKRGYKLRSQHFEIPNFIKWRYEEKCRDTGVIGYERLNSCVVKAAKEGNYQFVESARFSKEDSKEAITIWLTSNFTRNKVYKIAYETGITGINRGSSAKIAYLRSIKVYEFWRRINQKYGTPDNKEDVLWGLGANKPYMKASTGHLLLEDPMLRELDYTRMSREDQRFMNTNLYNF